MKIKVALIRSEHFTEAYELTEILQRAMNVGDMYAVDQTTEKLLFLVDKEYSVLITNLLWHQLISSIRNIFVDFKSDYLIEQSQLEIIMSAGLGAKYKNVIEVMEMALELKGIVLQLPYEEENLNV